MRRKIPILLILFCMAITESCIEPYAPDIGDYENLLIVDGLITNLKGPYEVTLARSFAYDGGLQRNVSGAAVKVIDNLNNEYVFDEISVGVYQNNDTSFIGIIGNEYKLSVITKDGSAYETEFQELKSSIIIDSVYYQYKPSSDGEVKGIQIYTDSHDPDNSTWYYGWTYEEAWEFKVPYVQLKSQGTLQTCYKTNSSNELMIGTSENNASDQLKLHPLYYISYNNNRLRFKYCALLRQYSISKSVYKYLSELKKINEQGGSLYDAAPSALRGNVYNINDENETVLGMFQVSGVTEKVFFINGSDLRENGFIPHGFEYCERYVVEADDSVTIQDYLDGGMMIMDRLTDPPRVEIVTGPLCFDCTLSGTLEKPDFWIE
jgi:hypothetical protein